MNLRLLATLISITLALFACPGWGQAAETPGEPAPAAPVTAESLRTLIAELEAQTGGDQSERRTAIELYKEALANVQRRDEALRQKADFQRLIEQAPAQLKSIRDELAAPPTDVVAQVPPDATLAQLEQQLAQAQAELAAATQQLNELQAESKRRDERRPQINALLTQLRTQLAETTEAIRLFAPSESPLLNDARRLSLTTRSEALEREIEALETEIASYDERRELLPARRDRAARRVATAQKLVDQWQAIVGERRRLEAQRAAEEAERLRRQAARQHPVLKAFAEETERLANLRLGDNGTISTLAEVSEKLTRTHAALEKLRKDYQSVQRRIEATQLNRATGLLLRVQYAQLPQISDLRQDLREATRLLERSEVAWIEWDEERARFADVNEVAQGLLAQIEAAGDVPAESRADLEAAARELAAARQTALTNLYDDASKQVTELGKLTEATQLFLQAVSQYRAYIEERILWIRSVPEDRINSISDYTNALAWATDPDSWNDALTSAIDELASKPLVAISLGSLLVLTFVLRVLARRRLRDISSRVSRYRTDSYVLTFQALGLTLAGSLFVPAMFFVAGWVLLQPVGQLSVGKALGESLQHASLLALILVFSRSALRPKGLFDAHFRWPVPVIQSIRRNLSWFVPAVLSIVVIGEIFERSGDESNVATIGRLMFTAHMIALAAFVQRVLRPGGPAISEFARRHAGSLLARSQWVWYSLAVGLPITLSIVSWLGYHYTATELFRRVQYSLFLVVALILLQAMLQRWLFIARRSVAIEDAKRRRDQAQSEGKASSAIDEDRLNLPAISAQTQQLFRASIFVISLLGFYAIWAAVLPALRMLDRVQIWPDVRVMEATVDAGVPILSADLALPLESMAGTTGTAPTPSETPESGAPAISPMQTGPLLERTEAVSSESTPELVVSLADVGLALIAFIATLIAFRNVPGLVEMVVLQRLPLDAGSRYALSTVMRYLIAIIGVSIAFNTLGVSWRNVQWLAAALTFGLAFGLQEIFANFVSGLIILAERPVRVGDTVTVGNVIGTVARIRMRATTIVDWDRKELIIPNKTFITDQVINWTLTDSVLRTIIKVGVSYESDVDKVESLLLRLASQNPSVLADPPPQALFWGFGDSTLDFELRIFIARIEHLQPVRHQLHNAIIKAFREAGIEIAFPQRDLHIRSCEVELVKDPARTSSDPQVHETQK